jgi:hypothetical protein
MTIELRDGSRVAGKSLDDKLSFHSATLGDLNLAVSGIRSIAMAEDGATARVTEADGDALDVQFITPALRVETGFGKTDLPVKLVRSVKVTPLGQPGLSPSELPSGLVALWPGEGNGNDSANGHDATVSDSMTYAPAKYGLGFNFTGPADTVSVPASPALDVGAGAGFTLGGWISPVSTTDQEPLLEWRGNGRGINQGVQLWISVNFGGTGGAGCIFANIVDTYGGVHIFASPPGIIQPGTLQYVSLTYDKASGLGKIYLNGSPVASSNLGSFTPKTDTALLLGQRADVGDYHYQGIMADVSVYNRALSDAEVQVIAGAATPGRNVMTPVPARVVETNEPGFRLTIQLRDGSRIVGKSPGETLRFQSASLGELKLPLAGIRAIEFVGDGGTARLTATNGDELDVQFINPTLRVETGFGKTDLPVKLIRSLKISANGRSAQLISDLPSGLVSFWAGDGDALDSVGGNNGTLCGGATFGEGKDGQAFSFDGVNSFVKIPQSPGLNLADQLTISFWMKADADNPMNTYQGLVTSDHYLVEISNGYGGRMGVNFAVRTTGNQPMNQPMDWSGSRERLLIGSSYFPQIAQVNGGGAPVTPGVWHHIACTYDGMKLQLYIDGSPWGNPMRETGTILPMQPAGFLAIGSEDGRTTYPNNSANRYFKGAIGDVAIFNRALSPAEIQAICTAENDGEPMPPPPPSPWSNGRYPMNAPMLMQRSVLPSSWSTGPSSRVMDVD